MLSMFYKKERLCCRSNYICGTVKRCKMQIGYFIYIKKKKIKKVGEGKQTIQIYVKRKMKM